MNTRRLKKFVLSALVFSIAAGSLPNLAEAGGREKQTFRHQTTSTLKAKRPGSGPVIANPGADIIVLPKYGGNGGLPNTGFCGSWNGGNQSVKLVVKNNGATQAAASVTYVEFRANFAPYQWPVNVATPALAPGQTQNVSVPIPADAWSHNAHPSVNFYLAGDVLKMVAETNETNNSKLSSCIGPAT